MTVLAVTVVGTSYQVAVLSGIVRSGGSPKVQMYNDIIFMWCIVLPLSALGRLCGSCRRWWCLRFSSATRCSSAARR